MFTFFFGIIAGLVLGLLIGVVATTYVTEGFQPTANGSEPSSDDPNDIIASAYADIDVKKMGSEICKSIDIFTKDYQDSLRKDPANVGKTMQSSSGETVDYVTAIIEQQDKLTRMKKDAFGCP